MSDLQSLFECECIPKRNLKNIMVPKRRPNLSACTRLFFLDVWLLVTLCLLLCKNLGVVCNDAEVINYLSVY